jgi:carboxylesterase type B
MLVPRTLERGFLNTDTGMYRQFLHHLISPCSTDIKTGSLHNPTTPSQPRLAVRPRLRMEVPRRQSFSCVVSKDPYTLQKASQSISASGTYGTWGFLPVTDGNFVQQLPSQQLLQEKVNGKRLLVGNNANEGPAFTPHNITTEDDLLASLRLTFPLFSTDDIAKILLYYPSTNASVDPSIPEYSTLGFTEATVLNESDLATGQQQRADVSPYPTYFAPSIQS